MNPITKTIQENREMKEDLKALLNDRRTGLKESSDTNKTYFAIQALFEDSNLALLEAVEKAIDEKPAEKLRALLKNSEVWINQNDLLSLIKQTKEELKK